MGRKKRIDHKKIHIHFTGWFLINLLALLLIDLQSIRAAEPSTFKQIGVVAIPDGILGGMDHLTYIAKKRQILLSYKSNNSLEIITLEDDLTNPKSTLQSNLKCTFQRIKNQNGVQGVDYSPSLDRFFVGNDGPKGKDEGSCNIFDGKTLKLLKSIPVLGADNAHDGKKNEMFYVAGDKGISVIDGKSMELKTTIDVEGSAKGFKLDAKNKYLYVNVTGKKDSVVVIDLATNRVARKIDLPMSVGVSPVAINEDGSRLFLGCRKTNEVITLEVSSGKVLGRASIPTGVDDVSYDAKAKMIYASCGEGFLAVLKEDTDGKLSLIEKIATAKGAKTSYFDSETSLLFVAVPKTAMNDPHPSIFIYRAIYK